MSSSNSSSPRRPLSVGIRPGRLGKDALGTPSPNHKSASRDISPSNTTSVARPSTVPSEQFVQARRIPSFILREPDEHVIQDEENLDGRPWTSGLKSHLNNLHDYDNNRITRIKEQQAREEAERIYNAKVLATERAYNSYTSYMHQGKPHHGEISTTDAQKLFRDVGLAELVTTADVRSAISSALAFTSKGKDANEGKDIPLVMMDFREFRKTLLALAEDTLGIAHDSALLLLPIRSVGEQLRHSQRLPLPAQSIQALSRAGSNHRILATPPSAPGTARGESFRTLHRSAETSVTPTRDSHPTAADQPSTPAAPTSRSPLALPSLASPLLGGGGAVSPPGALRASTAPTQLTKQRSPASFRGAVRAVQAAHRWTRVSASAPANDPAVQQTTPEHTKSKSKLTPAPTPPSSAPGTYIGPCTLWWPHPPAHGRKVLLRAKEDLSAFRKRMTEQHAHQPPPRRNPLDSLLPRRLEASVAAEQGYYTPQGIGRVICTVCGRIFLNATILAQHSRSHQHKTNISKLYKQPSDGRDDDEDDEQVSRTSSAVSAGSQKPREEGYERYQEGGEKGLFWNTMRIKLAVTDVPLLDTAEALEAVEKLFSGTLTKLKIKAFSAKVRGALFPYLRKCLELGTEPNALFLEKPEAEELVLPRRLIPRVKAVQSLSAFISCSSWLRKIDVSSNDLRNFGCHALCSALAGSDNELEILSIANNDITASHRDDFLIDYSAAETEGIDDDHDGFSYLSARRKEGAWVGVEQIRALTALREVARLQTSMHTLDCSQNNLGDHALALVAGMAAECQSLTSLNLSNNARRVGLPESMETSGKALGRLIRTSTSLTELSLGWNGLGRHGAQEFASSLRQNNTLTTLDLSWNAFGPENILKQIALALSDASCALSTLDLSHNRIGLQSAFVLAEGISNSDSLRSIRLDGNPLQQSGARSIQRAAMNDAEDTAIDVSMEDCGVQYKGAQDFDPTEPSGSYSLDLSEATRRAVPTSSMRDGLTHRMPEYPRKVLFNLIQLVVAKEGEFSAGSMTLNGKSFGIQLPKSSSKTPDDAKRATPGRRMSMLLSDETMTLSNGEGVLFPGTNLPTTGVLEFKFGALFTPPTANDKLSDPILAAMRAEMLKHQSNIALKQNLEASLRGNYISSAQAVSLLQDAPDTSARVVLAVVVFHRLADPANSYKLFEELTEGEYDKMTAAIGSRTFAFTANNPTGHHVLHLSKDADREVALRLVSGKNHAVQLDQESMDKSRGRPGGPRVALDPVWRNAMLNRRPHVYSNTWTVPRDGVLELDYVAYCTPEKDPANQGQQLVCMRNSDLQERLEDSGQPREPQEILEAVREISNAYCFTCDQVLWMLLHMTKAIVMHGRFSGVGTEILLRWSNRTIAMSFTLWKIYIAMTMGRIPSLVESGNLDESQYKLRVELVVIVFRRTVDWHGLRHMVVEKLPKVEREELEDRLGAYNLFDPAMAVGHYDLHLENPEHRRIMQELLYLGEKEPGKNFMDVTYNDRDFMIPASWLKEVPNRGRVVLFYCREMATCKQIRKKHDGDPAWPAGCIERFGTEWVQRMRLIVTRMKLREWCHSSRDAFDKIDRDGGGSLNRTEIAVGLFKMGIWLSPPELGAMMGVLDSDGGGEVEYEEWNRFWNMHIEVQGGKLEVDGEMLSVL